MSVAVCVGVGLLNVIVCLCVNVCVGLKSALFPYRTFTECRATRDDTAASHKYDDTVTPARGVTRECAVRLTIAPDDVFRMIQGVRWVGMGAAGICVFRILSRPVRDGDWVWPAKRNNGKAIG